MYLKHYNLTLKPFEISPDPRFLWLGIKHKEALAAMKYGILDNKGFICLTGDVGTGKTTLVNALINSSEDNIVFAKFSDPPLDKLDFFNLAADAFGMNKKFSSKGEFISHLRRFLNNAYDHNQEVVLVIEEAQRFDQEQLEEIRLISNIERPDKKLINIIFVGQNEFDGILHKNKPLRQRVSIIHKLEPLQEVETKQYVIHRLKIAGSESGIFSPGAFREIYSFSEGNPRLINIICDLALLTGYAENKKIIEPETIRECAVNRLLPSQQKEAAIEYVKASSIPSMETKKGLHPSTLEDSPQILAKNVPPKTTRFKLAYVTSISMVFLLSILGYLYFFGDNHAPYRDFKTFLGQTFDRYIGSKLETSSQKPNEIATQQNNITGTQIQELDFTAQKASFENQIDKLKSRNEALAADLAELNGTKERIAELEGVVASREQTLSEAEQKITEMTNALDQEKKGQDLLRAELSTNAGQVTEFQQKLESSKSNATKFQEEIERYKKEIAAIQGQLSDLQDQKTSSDTQLDQLKSRNEALAADLAELKGAKERIAELEQKRSSYEELSANIQEFRGVKERVAALEDELATKDQALSQAEQKVAELTSALNQEKKGQDLLRAEFSTNAGQVTEFQQKLESSQSNAIKFQEEIERYKKDIAAIQAQLSNLQDQKTFSDTQLDQLKSRNEALTADLAELNGAKERIAELEGVMASREQTLSEAEQKITEMTNALDQEKTSREALDSERSMKADLVPALQEKLEAALSGRAELESDVEKSRKEIAALKEQVLDVNAQKDAYENQLEQQKSSYEELTADIQELKGVKERVAALEGDLATKDQALSQAAQKVTDLTNALDQEKNSRETLDSERSMKADLVPALQEKLEAALSGRAELETDVEKSRKEIAALQEQVLDVNAQKDAYENQLEQQKSSYEELTADIQELKGVKERVAAIEGDLVIKDQALSRSEQRISHLAKELDMEKKSKELLSSKLSSKGDLIAELQEKMENSQSNAVEFEAEIENSTIKINQLQEQLLNLKVEKASTETKLGQLKSRNEALTADLAELKRAKERIAELEGVEASHAQTLSQAEQTVTELTKALDREKASKETLDSEYTIKADLVADLREKLEAKLSSQAKLENDIKKSQKDIAALQSQLRERKAQQVPTESSPAIVDVKKESPSKSEAFAEQGEPLSPNDVIDWVIKQKAK